MHLEQILRTVPPSMPMSTITTTRQRRRPALLFGGPLEDSKTDSEVLNGFLEDAGSVKVARFEPLEQAFWDMRLYWRREGSEKD